MKASILLKLCTTLTLIVPFLDSSVLTSYVLTLTLTLLYTATLVVSYVPVIHNHYQYKTYHYTKQNTLNNNKHHLPQKQQQLLQQYHVHNSIPSCYYMNHQHISHTTTVSSKSSLFYLSNRKRRRRKRRSSTAISTITTLNLHATDVDGEEFIVSSTSESDAYDNINNNVNNNNNTNTDNTATVKFKYHHLTNIQRILCLSDLHTDHMDNILWLQQHVPKVFPKNNNTNDDLLIIAGDISHDISTFIQTIQIIQSYCYHIIFVPGNHEAWLSSSSSSSSKSISVSSASSASSSPITTKNNNKPVITSSLDKLQQYYDICRSMGVYVDPVYISDGVVSGNDTDTATATATTTTTSNNNNNSVWILPLQSWYDGSLSFNETLCNGFEKWPWMDFIRCKWDTQLYPITSKSNRIPKGLVEYFLHENYYNIIQPLHQLLIEQPQYQSTYIISVSHFAPNQQCLPDWKNITSPTFQTTEWLDHGAGPMSAKFAKVAGTKLLDEQIRSINCINNNDDEVDGSHSQNPRHRTSTSRHIHIFGHSHRPKDFEYQNIRYIHNPLGKVRERQLYMISPNVTFQLVWCKEYGEIIGPTIIRYWEEYGGGTTMLQQRMMMMNSKKSMTNQVVATTKIQIQGGRYQE